MDLTPTSIHNLIQEFKQLDSIMLKAYLRSGEILTTLTAKKAFKQIGDHIESSDDLFKELGLKKTDAYNRIGAFKEFSPYLTETNNICPSRLVKLLPMAEVMSESEKIEWIEKGEKLTARAFDDELLKAKGKKDSWECSHDQHITICKQCRARIN